MLCPHGHKVSQMCLSTLDTKWVSCGNSDTNFLQVLLTPEVKSLIYKIAPTSDVSCDTHTSLDFVTS